jgi:YidC/Oxa1 family membrane protein insertase
MLELWNLLLYHPLVNALVWLTVFTGNLGLGIIALTVLLRLAMTPLILPSLRLSKKVQELAPEIAKLKDKYKDDKQAMALAQAQLYKDHGANPAAGCLPQIIQLLVLIALFNALNYLLHTNGQDINSKLNPILYVSNQLPPDYSFSTKFLYMDLIKPDVFYLPSIPIPLPGVFLLLSALVQFISAQMMTPAVSQAQKVADKTAAADDDAMVAAQKQMLYLFPLMTVIFGFQFPSGMVLYWLVFSAVAALQQYQITGWGGLTPWLKKLNLVKS